jgi:hypothetical protein
MEYVLVVAALYNLVGAYQIWFQSPKLQIEADSIPSDYMQFRIFTGGTAFIFSLIYTYVFFVPQTAVPLLFFGIALKIWSFVSSLISYKKFNFPKDDFLKTGVGNLVFSVLLVVYLLNRPTL